MKRSATRPVLITDAEKSQDQQLHAREIRYAVMMGMRVVCLVTGALLAYWRVPLWGVWSSLCVVGMVLLPWMAVIIANDRLPRTEHTLRGRLRRNRNGDEQAAPAALPTAEHRTFDPDEHPSDAERADRR
ncbi:hypothetical protein Athai_35090 [Actinocatenispora thailandica]|uniref:DUF3099 domain-containing protein n=1 Tax=Actinocatenispora thailandica TaxID=227318 RepID=A0A7R7HXU6_9ACTN|nr:DUF3099 domain-containing protein [Actinocatenispora thailandica]BCJ36006.1 hypothetical protein Athai_35090 [Actinocatenispora thailandica]